MFLMDPKYKINKNITILFFTIQKIITYLYHYSQFYLEISLKVGILCLAIISSKFNAAQTKMLNISHKNTNLMAFSPWFSFLSFSTNVSISKFFYQNYHQKTVHKFRVFRLFYLKLKIKM